MGYKKGDRPGEKIESIDFSPNIANENFSNFRIEWCRGKKVKFRKCNFASALIKNCYFHEAEFVDCNFTGCSFTESNFRNAKFVGCDLRYAVIRNSFFETKAIIDNLPEWENARRDLLRSARKNAESHGDVEGARLLLRAEMEASEEHWRCAVRGSTNYYREHYPKPWGVVSSFIKMWSFRAGKWFWGHGESPLRLTTTLLIWLSIWVLISSSWNVTRFDNAAPEILGAFLGVESPAHVSTLGRWAQLALTGSRFVFLGLFVTLFVRRFSRR